MSLPQTQQIGKTATTIRKEGLKTIIRYHNTDVVTFTPDTITLDTGGWWTVTTKNRMNQTSNQYNLGYYIYQEKYAWFINYNGTIHPFKNERITIKRVQQ